MKSRIHWPLSLLFIAAVLMGSRFVWTVSNSPTGWPAILTQWKMVAAEQFGASMQPLSEKAPRDQANFWLNEIDHITATGRDPETALGAAWMLDAPQYGFIIIRFHLTERFNLPEIQIPRSSSELDDDAFRAAIKSREDAFESRCRQECLKQIENALRLAPNDVEVWRDYALLLFQHHLFRSQFEHLEHRREDWLDQLETCASHDSDNALYDYLASFQLWSSSAERTWSEDLKELVIEIHDEDRFQLGNEYFQAGLEKPFFKTGKENYAAVLALFRESSLPRYEWIDTAYSRLELLRGQMLAFNLNRWETAHVPKLTNNGKFEEALAKLRNVRRLAEQITPADNPLDVAYFTKNQISFYSLAKIAKLQKQSPELLSSKEFDDLQKSYLQATLRKEITQAAIDRWNQKTDPLGVAEMNEDPAPGYFDKLNTILLVTLTQKFVVWTFMLTILFGIIAFCGRKMEQQQESIRPWVVHSLIWILATGLSFLLLGMCPARVVSSRIQTLTAESLIGLAFLSVLLLLLFRLQRRFATPPGQFVTVVLTVTMPILMFFYGNEMIEFVMDAFIRWPLFLWIMMIVLLAGFGWIAAQQTRLFFKDDASTTRRKGLLLSIVALLMLTVVYSGRYVKAMLNQQSEIWARIPEAVWNIEEYRYSSADQLRSGLELERASWNWALVQWDTHHGPLATVLAAVLILLVGLLFRKSRLSSGTQKSCKWPEIIRRISWKLSQSCGVAMIVFATLYFYLSPTIIQMADTRFQTYWQRLTNPEQTRKEFEATVDAVRADESAMKRIRERIAEYAPELIEDQNQQK